MASSFPYPPSASQVQETVDFLPGPRDQATVTKPPQVVAAIPPAPVPLPKIGQYQLSEQIGKGGMGVVFRAMHLRLKRWVAVKLLPDPWALDTRMVARFEREMEVIGRLDHPNIVRAHDAGYAAGYHYLAMELIDGVNLLQVVRTRPEVSVPDACEMVRQAAVGLGHAYEHGLIHRDIKPNNLMLSTAGVVKVLDLGLARLSRSEPGEFETATGVVMGTPDYMAPEQWDSSQVADIRADIYSLGCTLHTLLSRRPPFSGSNFDSRSSKRAAHFQTPPPRLAESRPDVPEGVQTVIDRAMAKDPHGRFQTPGEFAEALGEYARGADLPPLARSTLSVLRTQTDALLAQYQQLANTKSDVSQLSAETAGHTPAMPAVPRRRFKGGGPAAGLLALLVGLAAVVFGVWFSGDRGRVEPPEPTGTQPPAAHKPQPKAGEWFDLLADEPTKAVWPLGRAGTESGWKHDPTTRELWLTAREQVMVQLTELGDVDFELECQVSQNPWIGNVGVYFGDQPAGGESEAVMVGLSGFGLAPGGGAIGAMLAPVRHAGQVFKGREILGTTPIPRPTNTACKFWVLVNRTGEYRVQWEGQSESVPLLPVDRVPRPRSTAGGLGLYAQNSTSQIRNARLRILPSQTQ
jgi:serine/threonine protein kinase